VEFLWGDCGGVFIAAEGEFGGAKCGGERYIKCLRCTFVEE